MAVLWVGAMQNQADACPSGRVCVGCTWLTSAAKAVEKAVYCGAEQEGVALAIPHAAPMLRNQE